MCGALAGSDRPFLFASGVVGLAQGRAATENDASPMSGPDAPRGGAEQLAFSYVEQGVRSVALRFSPTVHGDGDHGFISTIVGVARDRGVAGYVGDGSNRWPAVHVLDTARVVALALEKAPAGAVVHGVAEEGIPAREIAAAIGRGFGVPAVSVEPEKTFEHFGWIGGFFALDAPTSSVITREMLGWNPTHAGLIADLESGSYFRTPARSS